jgi:hypothetical protein
MKSPLTLTSTFLSSEPMLFRHAELKEIHWITYKKVDIGKFLTIRELTKQPDIVVDILPLVSLSNSSVIVYFLCVICMRLVSSQ